MPIDTRSWYSGEHPSACNCVSCERRRRERRAKKALPWWKRLLSQFKR